MFTVCGTTFGAFCATSFSFSISFLACWTLWKCSCSRQEPPHPLYLYVHILTSVCTWLCVPTHTPTCVHVGVCVIWRVLMQPKYKAQSMCWNAAPGMGSIIPAYFTSRVPGLELARGPLSPNRWKWAEERWRIGKRRRRNRMDRRKKKGGTGGGRRVSLFSLSAVLKTTSPHNASAAADGPPLIQTTLGPSVPRVCHKVCVHALDSIWWVKFIGFQFG